MTALVDSVESRQLSLVLIEDNAADAATIVRDLVSAGLHVDVVRATTKAGVRAALAKVDGVDAVLCGYRGKGVKVWQALEIIKASVAAVPLIVISRGMSDEQAAECMRLGATDYILKKDMGRLPHALTQAIHHAEVARAGREAERSYRLLFDNLPMAVFRATAEGQILHANPAAVEMFRFPDVECLMAASVFDLHVNPDDRRALLVRLQKEGHVLDFECLMRRADGSEFWFSRVVHAVREEDGRIIVWESIGRDSTERLEAIRRVRESEASLNALVETAPDAVIRMDDKGAITDWNSAAQETFGWKRAEVMGHLVSETIIPPELRERHEHGLARFHQDGTTTLIGRRWDTFEGLRKNGEVFPIELAVSSPIPLGETKQIVAFARDISERKRAERLLSARVAQQTVLLELSRAGLEGRESPDFLATAVEMLARGTSSQFATVLEQLPSDNSLVRVASFGHPGGMPLDPTTLDASFLTVDALQSELPVLTFNYQANPEIKRSPWMIREGVLATMAVGIRGRDRPIGVVAVHSNVAAEFSPDDLQFMQLASNIISVAVERKSEEKQRKLLLGHLVTAQETERKTIAEDVHDDAVQVMTAANMRLELFRMALTDPIQVESAQKLQEIISLAIGRLRNLLFELAPPDLDRYGLAAACRGHLEQFEADSGVRWELRSDLYEEPAPPIRILLFRIFQEALANVRKHAHATAVTVSLNTVDGGAMMRVVDDGSGFHAPAAEPIAGHLGLISMRERAEIAGGWFRLSTELGRGTEVSTWVPASGRAVAVAARATEVMAVA